MGKKLRFVLGVGYACLACPPLFGKSDIEHKYIGLTDGDGKDKIDLDKAPMGAKIRLVAEIINKTKRRSQ